MIIWNALRSPCGVWRVLRILYTDVLVSSGKPDECFKVVYWRSFPPLRLREQKRTQHSHSRESSFGRFQISWDKTCRFLGFWPKSKTFYRQRHNVSGRRKLDSKHIVDNNTLFANNVGNFSSQHNLLNQKSLPEKKTILVTRFAAGVCLCGRLGDPPLDRNQATAWRRGRLTPGGVAEFFTRLEKENLNWKSCPLPVKQIIGRGLWRVMNLIL